MASDFPSNGPTNLIDSSTKFFWKGVEITSGELNDEALSTIWESQTDCAMDDIFTIQFHSSTNIGTLVLIPGDTTKTEIEVSTGNSDDHSQN